MPELPDIVVYIECLEGRVVGQRLERVRIASPFVLRTADPPITQAEGKAVREIRRLGKRIVFALEDNLFLVLHLMIAGRLAWAERGAKIPGKVGLAALDFASGTLIFREASSKKRASIHLVVARARSSTSIAAGSRSSRRSSPTSGRCSPAKPYDQGRSRRSDPV